MAVVENGTLRALALDLETLNDLPQSVLGSASGVKEANFSFNSITGDSLNALAPFASLQVLVLDNNALASLALLPSLPSLRTLWLNNNSLDDLEELLNVLSRQCPQLEYLSLLRNPCCPNELVGKQETEYRRYRLYTKFRIPTLKNLDSGTFTDAEAHEAREKGKFFRAAAVKQPVAEAQSDKPSSSSTKQPESSATTASGPNNNGAADDDEEDMFAKFDKKKAAKDVSSGGPNSQPTQGPFFTQQRHYYSGKTSEGNRFIKDDVL